MQNHTSTLTFTRPDESHLHLRDPGSSYCPICSRAPVRACDRHAQPETTGTHAGRRTAYRDRILAAAGMRFNPLIPCI